MEMIFDAERDFKNCLDTAYKEGYKEGLAAAKEEIKAANKAEGLAEEIEKGKAEGRADIAKKMKIKGFDLNLISDITGLSIDEINKL
jgi:predicted transposase/invertase (TIGR01784 family)